MPLPDCSLIIPTRNRSRVLAETLQRIESLPDGGFEIIVVDNGSTDDTVDLRKRFPRARWIELGTNIAAAARNIGAVAARGWLLLMLDDDSWPQEGTIDQLVSLFHERLDLGAAGLRVRLADPPYAHDAGGVPGVFFNCGGAVRRAAFLDAGGFPIDYEYYVEEYDLCCRLLKRGWRIEPRGDLLVWHRRVSVNRDANRMVRLLIRNNLRLWRRYTPDERVAELIEDTIRRYRQIAQKENGLAGFEQGLSEDSAKLAGRFHRFPLSMSEFESLMGLERARQTLREWADKHDIRRVAVWSRGKGYELLLRLLQETRIEVEAVFDRVAERPEHWRGIAHRPEKQFKPTSVDGIVAGSLSCGAAEDIARRLQSEFSTLPVVSLVPWLPIEVNVDRGQLHQAECQPAPAIAVYG